MLDDECTIRYHRQNQNVTLMESSIIFDISTTKAFLAEFLEGALDKSVSSEPMEVNGVEVTLERVGKARLEPIGKKVGIFLPLSIKIKRPAGLFSVEGSGALNLHLSIDFDITKGLMLKSKTELLDHTWIDKPILEIGALNIPIETLVNLVLNHHESIITAKIDSSIKEFSDLSFYLFYQLKIGFNSDASIFKP